MVKRKKSIRGSFDKISVQKSLSIFLKEEGKEEDKDKENKIEDRKEIETIEEIVEDRTIEKRLPSQIETDYYEKSRIDDCAKRLRERFNVNIEIIPVRYGSKPPINQKIYGYYMYIIVKDRVRDIITKFIKEECNLKIY